ncbi:MAG: 2-acyl-glycerophospho-ethanolamine acyltransferase [Desulfobulbus propionicus]|nr:MAG: 2-acyl-glycerophospho-ethanolamine acyltransferase [Desulfobulbus propionicus]
MKEKPALDDKQPNIGKNHTKTRLAFIAMASTYCLGAFNDNYFKQAAMLLAVSAGLSSLQGWATMLFALPFILFSAHGGWCADTFSKKKVVICSKTLELLAMIIGGVGMLTENWACILTMVFIMALQSTFFSPALNGSIPEMYTTDRIPRVNAILKMATTLAILAGIALAGISLDQQWIATSHFSAFFHRQLDPGVLLVSLGAVMVALLGLFASFGLRAIARAGGTRSFPWVGPYRSFVDLFDICRDRQLCIAILADTWFYFLASLAVQIINTMGLDQFGFSQTKTSLLSTALMLGVCLGSLFAAKLVQVQQWSRYLVLSAAGMGAGIIVAATGTWLPESLLFVWLLVSLTATGTAGGLFLIPVTSVLQIRPADNEKGRTLAAASFSSFTGILLAGFIFAAIDGKLQPSSMIIYLGIVAIFFAFLLSLLIPDVSVDGKQAKRPSPRQRKAAARCLRALLALRYKVQVKGLEAIRQPPDKGILFLANHPALIDPVILVSQLLERFAPRPLADAAQIDRPGIRQVSSLTRPIIIPDIGTDGTSATSRVMAGLDEVVRALESGDNVLFYPAGRLKRKAAEELGGNSGVEYILRQTNNVEVVLVRSSGLWGSSFGYGQGGRPSLFGQLRRYILALLAGLFLFVPKREVLLEFTHETTLHTLKNRNTINTHLETFYNQNLPTNTHVPYFWWQGNTAKQRPEPEEAKETAVDHVALDEIDPELRHRVLCKIAEVAGTAVSGEEHLHHDLAIDSLGQMELVSWLEQEFGIAVNNPVALQRVNHFILAAAGQLAGTIEDTTPPPADWFLPAPSVDQEHALQEVHIGELFLRRAHRNPDQCIIADNIAKELHYRDLLTAILLLLPYVKTIRAKRVGIMLPASVSAVVAWLTVLFAGKTPVMLNWTVGIKNMRHGINQTGVTHILSAKKLYDKVEEMQGEALTALSVTWLHLDRILPSISLPVKIWARLRSYLGRVGSRPLYQGIRQGDRDEAVVLFTSGSEAAPKTVPLSHTNLLANLADFNAMVDIGNEDRLLAMLPPFHSLGLTTTILFPLLIGIRAAYYPNPTEPGALVAMAEKYKTTLIISTPTFLNAMLLAATTGQLTAVRLVFTGAEKCPEAVRARLADTAPQALLCEGYGITECSPLVSLNTPEHNKAGTIGRVLSSLEYVLVDEQQQKRVDPGERGLLLVRGPSVFAGYLVMEPGQGFCQFAGKTWYNSGDYVREDEDGHLIFAGRKKRFVKIGGEMISLPAIEAALATTEREAANDGTAHAVIATGEDSSLQLVLFSTEELSWDAANQRIRTAGLSGLHRVHQVRRIAEIPVLGTGKTDYKVLEKQLAHEHRALAAGNDTLEDVHVVP